MNEPTAFVTILIICVTGFISYRGFQSEKLQSSFLFSTVPILRDREYRRVLTSGFIHADWAHLMFNMFSLYSFGKYIELFYGISTLLWIYFSSIVGGGLLALVLHRHHEYRALGASGGVCGVIFASLFLLPGGGVRMFLIPITIPAWAFAILFILASFYGIRTQRDNIGHDAHLGGALVGLGVATLLYPTIVLKSPWLLASVVVLTVVLAVFTFRFSLAGVAKEPRGPQRAPQSWLEPPRRWFRSKERDQEILDQLLDKISHEGLESLTENERSALEELSRRRSDQDAEH